MSDIVERLRNACDGYRSWPHRLLHEAADEIEELREALERIARWAEAYPTDIFPEATPEYLRNAHAVLKQHDMTIDRISASNMRHCLKGVGDIAKAALAHRKREGR